MQFTHKFNEFIKLGKLICSNDICNLNLCCNNHKYNNLKIFNKKYEYLEGEPLFYPCYHNLIHNCKFIHYISQSYHFIVYIIRSDNNCCNFPFVLLYFTCK